MSWLLRVGTGSGSIDCRFHPPIAKPVGATTLSAAGALSTATLDDLLMCGRFTLTTDDFETVAGAFGARIQPQDHASYRPRFNAAPGDTCWIVTLESLEAQSTDGRSRRRLSTASWGFSLANSPGRTIINARAETLHEKASFAEAFWTSRCGVLVDGFLEWTGPKQDRQPLWFHRPDRSPFLLGGVWRDQPDARGRRQFAIVTTEPNAQMQPHHDRMPVILPPGRTDAWLEPPRRRNADAVALAATLFAPAPDGWLAITAVDKRVSDVRNDDPSLLQPVTFDTTGGSKQGNLF